ncbi:cold shock domain-containing protein [Serratia nevei]|uniref:cold shock domain-containing protein n=1 Tax=Serratia nevei TaxID=2703794 RepID=UPI0018D98FE8|nr:cold shock domain-containing protein [Serratia nevei]MBH2891264.1 cold shock domain-containing protein [Serratia marcescens]MBN5392204.1 cold shock domain-containing protein [Serratia marcescens]MDR8477076.1 cold shock domain-containing protein [Serratia nevei]
MSNIDSAEENLRFLLSDIRNNLSSIESEEDAKIQIINRIFNECLGWSFTQFACENKHESGYSDYVMKIGGESTLVVEAKRLGILEIDSSINDRYRTLKLSGSSLKKSMPGIQQAFAYASEEGIPISVVTDGTKWIIFKTWVYGAKYKDKEAFVFPSLESVENSFSIFYELLSYECFSNKTYNIMFDTIHNSRQSLSTPLKAPLEIDEINILKKSPIAFDLEKIFNGFFTQLTGDDNSEIMNECFVESNESRIADYSLEKITTSILNNLPKEKNKVELELSELIQGNVQARLPADSDMSVFIVGPTGSGKTTYISRFFSKILPTSTRENCLTLNINCLDATGDDTTTTTWISEKIISLLEHDLFNEGYPEYSDLQGMYFSYYKRMSSGYLKKIYESDRHSFDIKFSEFLEKEVRTNREGYLESLLHFAVHNRKKLPIIVVDNTDEFSLDFKIKIFQFCNAYRRKIKYCMLMFPVTDKSAWSFSKTDIFTIHQSRSFFLPTPSPREVFRKRIDFLNKKLVTANAVEKREYLTSKGIRIELKDVKKFAQVLDDVFVENSFTAKTLGELTNYNIRSIMNLSKRIITSPVMRIEDLITTYLTTEPINYSKFIDALIRGDYEAYRVSTGDDFGVISTFKVNSSKIHSPLLILRILSLLKVIKLTGRDVEERHCTVQSIVQYFETLGVDSVDIQRCLTELVSLRLIEPYDPSASVLDDNQKLAISYKGLAHYDLSTKNSVYFYQMAITTGISDPEVASNIKGHYKSKSNRSFSEITTCVRKLFSEYLIREDNKFVTSMQDKEQYSCQLELIRDIKSFSVDKNGANGIVPDNITSFLGEKLVGKVERYDPEKDYGFLSIKEINQDVYFRLSNLKVNEMENMFDSDIVYCSLEQGNKGIVVNSIYGFVEGKNEFQLEKCIIRNFNSKRGFGFVQVGSTSSEVFFHRTAFPTNFHEHLKEGVEFLAEIRLREDGKFQVRRCLELL